MLSREDLLAVVWERLHEWRDANPEGIAANDVKWDDVCGAMANLREELDLPSEVEKERAEELLGQVTRYTWRKPGLTDKEIVGYLRYHPSVLAMKESWKLTADDYTKHLIGQVEEKEEEKKRGN